MFQKVEGQGVLRSCRGIEPFSLERFWGTPGIRGIFGPVAIWSRGAGSEESVIGDGPGSAPRGRPRGVAIADAVVKAGAVGIGCAVRGRSERCCTFGRDPSSDLSCTV